LEIETEKEPTDLELITLEYELFKVQDVSKKNYLKAYLKDIGQVKLLSRDEEVKLAHDMSNARDSQDDESIRLGKDARDQLILANLRLVVSIAKRYMSTNRDLMDLIQDGTMGLMKAVDRYQVERGFKFSTYATWWIRQSISRSISNTSRTVRLPVYMHEMISLVQKIKRVYTNEHGIEPTIETLSKMSNLPIPTLSLIYLYSFDTLSMDQTIGEDDSTLLDILIDTKNLDPNQHYELKILEDYILEILDELSERERDIIKMRFGIETDEKTLAEIGEILDITRERVRQIQVKAMKHIQKRLTKT
jgi:RNA polymerase primary sigma factor